MISSASKISAISARSEMFTAKKVALLAREPFRVLFPAATLAGIVGVALWPLNLLGLTATYPGQFHARLMAHGFLGGFIFGFLGTAMPRLLSARPLRPLETGVILSAHLAMASAYALGNLPLGNLSFLGMITAFVAVMAPRIRASQDLPPPGFVLVGLSLACVAAGATMALFENDETAAARVALQCLLTYQGFILLPILGIGPFILPRFFGAENPHEFPKMLSPSKAWLGKALFAAATGIVIIATFVLEANGRIRAAYGLRFAAALIYIALEMPLRNSLAPANVFATAIRISLIGMLSGFASIALFPVHRVALLHVTLVGGFAVITFVIATRVLFGHSGKLARLQTRNRWLPISVGLMLFAMATRVSGDFWPRIMASHYIYGAFLWIAAVLLWSCYALSNIFTEDTE